MDPRTRMEFLAAELLQPPAFVLRPGPSRGQRCRVRPAVRRAAAAGKALSAVRRPQFAQPPRSVPTWTTAFPRGRTRCRCSAWTSCTIPQAAAQWLQKTAALCSGNAGFTVEEKIDGASIVLYYDRGELQYALTRGNGLAGNDVTDNVRTIRQVPAAHRRARPAGRARRDLSSRAPILPASTPGWLKITPTRATWPPVRCATSSRRRPPACR